MASKAKKVFVGLSGGVDSAVSLALLQKSGYDVVAVFIKVWQPDWIACTWREDRRDAMRVAAHLGVPFVTLDLEREYKEGVIDYMIAEYKAGRTPNPDVMCNREVKFGAFWMFAKENGADFIATGHYARVHHTPFCLLVGKDNNKDQSYFLWTLNQGDLEHVLFPVGHLQKPEVRQLAKQFKLPNADKKDSQGLCFIGKVDVKDFLKHYIPVENGDVLDASGNIIGQHGGAQLMTIGERRGFTIDHKTPTDQPYYVIKKDVDHNTITVSNKLASQILPGALKTVSLEKVNWVSGEIPTINADEIFSLQARSRYRQKLQDIRIVSAHGSEVAIQFENPQDTLTSGQSLVIYDDEICLGGGVIRI